MTQFTIIAAMDENHLIGCNNELPWHLPADLKNFKSATLGKTVLMGRKTCESLPFPLPKRKNLVLSRNKSFIKAGFTVIQDILNLPDEEIMVIGGANIYKWLLPYSTKMILTFIDESFEGDTYFPDFCEEDWNTTVITRHPHSTSNPNHSFKVVTFLRN